MIGDGRIRAHITRHEFAYSSAWWVIMIGMLVMKLAGVADNPWPIVLAPFWLPPLVVIACGLFTGYVRSRPRP